MKTFLLQAPRDFVDAGIPKEFMLQVISSTTGCAPGVSEIRDALHRAGFKGRADSWASPGNWKTQRAVTILQTTTKD
jgi:uncharacterized protein YidB (DUF937 family)